MFVFVLLFLRHCDALGLAQNDLSTLGVVDRFQRIVLHHYIRSIDWSRTNAIARAETSVHGYSFSILR